MNDLEFNMSNKWTCPSCKISNENRASKCAFCGTSQPSNDTKAEMNRKDVEKNDEEMMKLLYRLINPLHINQKKRLLRYIEDTF